MIIIIFIINTNSLYNFTTLLIIARKLKPFIIIITVAAVATECTHYEKNVTLLLLSTDYGAQAQSHSRELCHTLL